MYYCLQHNTGNSTVLLVLQHCVVSASLLSYFVTKYKIRHKVMSWVGGGRIHPPTGSIDTLYVVLCHKVRHKVCRGCARHTGQPQGTGTSELCSYVFYSTTVRIPLCPLPFALPYFVGCPAHSGPPTPARGQSRWLGGIITDRNVPCRRQVS